MKDEVVMVKEVDVDVNSNMDRLLSLLPTTTWTYPTSGGVGIDDHSELWSEEEELGIPACPVRHPSLARLSLPNCQVTAVPLLPPEQPPTSLAHPDVNTPCFGTSRT